jgi:hypothetical protein
MSRKTETVSVESRVNSPLMSQKTVLSPQADVAKNLKLQMLVSKFKK